MNDNGQTEKKPGAGGAWVPSADDESVAGDAQAVFRKWFSEGVDPSEMYQRVSDLFDSDPQGAEKFFGADFMDTVDYFTHYWG